MRCRISDIKLILQTIVENQLYGIERNLGMVQQIFVEEADTYCYC